MMTKEQEETLLNVVKKRNEPHTIQLIASAGSGKTYTIIQTVNALLEQNPNNKIALITFTKKSAEEIKLRLQETHNKISFVGTIHALAYSIISKNSNKALNIIQNSDEVINNIINQNYGNHKISTEKISIDLESIPSSMKKNIHQKYLEYKKQNSFYDFDDLIKVAKDICYKNERSEIPFDTIIVDEFQDTSYDQIEFIQSMKSNKHFVVGDSKQSIYSFRGAQVDLFYNLQNYLPNVEHSFLSLNFRSQKKIVTFSNKVIATGNDKFCKEMRPTIKAMHKPILYCIGEFENVESVFKKYYHAKKKYVGEKESITILVRTNQLKLILNSYIKKKGYSNYIAMTIHQSKGLEFSHVVVFGLVKNILPHKLGNYQEELRLFYVAITRAQISLSIVTWQKNREENLIHPSQRNLNQTESLFLPIVLKRCCLKQL